MSAADACRGRDDVGGEALVGEAHDHRSVADRGGATFDRSRANVAHREDAGHARFQDALGTGAMARQDEAVVVERDCATEPVGVRCGSEEEEEGGERDQLAVAERCRLELALGAVQRGDLAASSDEDAGALEVVDQVVRHRLPEVGPAVEERHERATAGEPDRRLGGRVPAADDTDPRGAAAPGLLWSRGVEDADAFERLDLRRMGCRSRCLSPPTRSAGAERRSSSCASSASTCSSGGELPKPADDHFVGTESSASNSPASSRMSSSQIFMSRGKKAPAAPRHNWPGPTGHLSNPPKAPRDLLAFG